MDTESQGLINSLLDDVRHVTRCPPLSHGVAHTHTHTYALFFDDDDDDGGPRA